MVSQFSILVVEDTVSAFEQVQVLLADQGYCLHHANSAQQALSWLDSVRIDLILLATDLKTVDSAALCARVRAMPMWASLPITVMMPPLTELHTLSKMLLAGADDYIRKPLDRLELLARVRSKLRVRRQYQQLVVCNDRLEATVRQRTAKLQNMVFQDALTQLPSRATLLQTIAERFQTKDDSFSLVYLDCDQFNRVNGSFGYAVGDQVLVKIAQRLKQYLCPGDLLVRAGEDEFCFLLKTVGDASAVEAFVQQILRSFDRPFLVDCCDIYMTACAGMVMGCDVQPIFESAVDDGSTMTSLYEGDRSEMQRAERVLQAADTAMYEAKIGGRGCYQAFDPQMYADILGRLTLESDLQRALKRQEFTLHYQPIVDLTSREIAGVEALVRWHHPTRGMVSPAEFVPCMETSGLIVPLGLMVLEKACYQLYEWQQQEFGALTMSVNLSVRQFKSPTLLADVDRILEKTQVDPRALKLEITESAIMDNVEEAIALTKSLRSRGIQISIDDFGTGYSSLGYLHRFPIDNLKIDRSFVQMLVEHDDDTAAVGEREYHVVSTIIALSKQLNLSVIAEGIETRQQMLSLRRLGCQFGQGYFFSKPWAVVETEKNSLMTAVNHLTRVVV